MSLQTSEQAVLLLVAHQPLASAFRLAALHVFPEAQSWVHALDVPPNQAPEETLQNALVALGSASKVLLLTDIPGATPSNVALEVARQRGCPLIAGMNLPLLLRSIGYCAHPLPDWCALALEGGHRGLVQLS